MRGRKVNVVVSAPGDRTRDSSGRWEELGADVTVLAHVASAGRAVDRIGYSREQAGRSEQADAIVLLPRGTEISPSHVVHLTGTGVVDDGEYSVRAISRTVKHVRVAVRRVEP